MLTVAAARARSSACLLPCTLHRPLRHKSTLSAINRSLRNEERDSQGGRNRSVPRSAPKNSKSTFPIGRVGVPRTQGRQTLFPRRSEKASAQDGSDTRRPPSARQVLAIPFTDRHDFTVQNWNRLMATIRDAETEYVKLLPTRPPVLPVYDKAQGSGNLKRELKLGLKEAVKTAELRLEPLRQNWLRLALHLRSAMDNASKLNASLDGRPWFQDSDPASAKLAATDLFSRPKSPKPEADDEYQAKLRLARPLSQNERREYIRSHVDRLSTLIKARKPIDDDEPDLSKLPSTSHVSEQPEEELDRDDHDIGNESLGFGTFQESDDSATSQEFQPYTYRPEGKNARRARLAEERRLKKEETRQSHREKARAERTERGFGAPEDRNGDKHRIGQLMPSRQTTPEPARTLAPAPAPSTFADLPRRGPSDERYVSIPYTTAASEFLYGLNVVVAALKARRRKLYNLYIHDRALSHTDKSRQLRTLAQHASLKYHYVEDDFLPKMDKMAQGRPHNGVILEASPLPALPIKSLGKLAITSTEIPVTLAEQSPEDREVNGAPEAIPFHFHTTWRKPLVLMLDGILDPGNLGNILRTAHFYGVDAVAVCVNTCAPINLSTVQKAASGAAEATTILSIGTPANFVTECAKNGWLVHAAIAPEAFSGKGANQKKFSQLFTDDMTSPLARGPSILMIGAEGEGLRKNLASKAEFNVGIRGVAMPKELDVGVESLNVGTAVAVLLEAFMKRPPNLEDLIESRVTDNVTDRIV